MVYLTVITREVSPAIKECELTHINREPIDYHKVVQQHDAYVSVFEKLIKEGYDVELIRLPALAAYPDSMFMEDVAMFYDGCAVIPRAGAESRRGEADQARRWVEFLRPGHTYALEKPAHTDGGDVFPVGKYIFVGQSTRTNDEAFAQLKKITDNYAYVDENGKGHRYECVRLPVKGRLHTKTAGSFLTDSVVLMDTNACPAEAFTSRGIEVLSAPASEEGASNPLSFTVQFPDGSHFKRVVVINAGYPKTSELVRNFASRETQAGRPTEVVELEMDEIAKAEGSLTCLSLLCYHKKSGNISKGTSQSR
ncbi:unnamed protein product [Phytomonas sp. EM1]|nr:unnamed protein product [Phytomonas sp. EM1]|eukprot:CCW62639.1 unnamed protein product [Phytomonas sp. isolate EM1]